MKHDLIKPFLRCAIFLASFSIMLCACSPETEDCPRYSAGIIPAGDQGLLRQLAKDTFRFLMDDTIRIFEREDSSFSSRTMETADIGPCGTEYYPERTTIRYDLDFGSPYYSFRIEQRPVYPEGQQLTLRFYNGYYYDPMQESFSFDPTASNLRELTEFRTGDTTYQFVKVIPSGSGGFLFISQNGEILEIRTSDGKIFIKAD